MFRHHPKRGFTLVEMMAAVVVLVLLLGLIFSMTTSMTKTIVHTSTKIDAFAAGRAAFGLLNQKLAQATLNTYWDYDNPSAPTVYYRQSDLQFVVRANTQNPGYGQEIYFQTPASYSRDPQLSSASGLLNSCGFFVSYGADTSFKPATLAANPSVYRYRLIQGMEPTENLATYSNWPLPSGWPVPTASQWTTFWTGSSAGSWTSSTPNTWPNFWANHAWINNSVGNLGNGTLNTNDTPLASNIIAMIVWPRLSTTDDSTGIQLTSVLGGYSYDSQYKALYINPATNTQPVTANQLPPTVQVTLVLISEAAAARLCKSSTPPAVIENALNTRFIDPTKYDADLNFVTAALATAHIDYQVLNTSVAIRESKWSDASQ